MPSVFNGILLNCEDPARFPIYNFSCIVNCEVLSCWFIDIENICLFTYSSSG